MNDDFEDSLREKLGRVVPEAPEGSGRAAGARAYTHRVRRTRTVLAVGVAAAVVGADVVIPSVLASSDDTASRQPTNLPRLSLPPLAHPFTCQHLIGGPIDGLHFPADGRVPDGAVLARMCPGSAG